MIHQTNLVIEACSAVLDVDRDNIESLLINIQQIREQWDMNIGISFEF